MFVRARDTHPRSIAKAISWKITGSMDTFVFGFIFTGERKLVSSITDPEMAMKMVLYYLYERALVYYLLGSTRRRGKAGVAALTEALAQEVVDQGILVNAVAPSIMDTPQNHQAMPKANYNA
jgi:uncharacterized membrane protein